MNVSHEISKAPPIGARGVLVIGMDEFFRLALVGLLKTRFDYTIIIEMNAFDCTHENLIEAAAVDLVVMETDWVPDCSVRLSNLRQQYPDARIVFISQIARRDDTLNALRAGAHGFVPKGICLADMIQAFTMVLSGTLYIPKFLGDGASHSREITSLASKRPGTDLLKLTPRQMEVLGHIVQGRSNKHIAKLMSLREGTVKIHVANLFRNLGVSNRSLAAAVGSRYLLVSQTHSEES